MKHTNTPFIREHSKKALTYLKWLLAALCLIGAYISTAAPIHPDEAVFLTIAKRINLGEIPYRDLFDHKSPGIYYLLALAIKGVGLHIKTIRILSLISQVYTTYVVYKIVFRFSQKQNLSSIAALTSLSLSILYQSTYLLTEVFMIPFLLQTTHLIISKTVRHWQVGLAGIFLGVALIFRQTAIINYIAIIVWILSSSHPFISKLKQAGMITLGMLSAIIIPTIYLYIHQALPDAIYQVITFNLDYAIRPIKLSLNNYLPVVLPLIPLFYLGALAAKGKVSYRNRLIILQLIATLPIVSIRPYHHYWLQSIPFLTILIFTSASISASKKIALTSYGIILALSQLLYLTTAQSGNLLDQYTTASEITKCNEITQTYQYALTKCPPPKHFYTPN